MAIEDVIARHRRRLIDEIEGPLFRSIIREYAGIIPAITREAERIAERAAAIAAQGGDPMAALLAEGRLRALERMIRADLEGLIDASQGRILLAERAAVTMSIGNVATAWAAYDVGVSLQIPAIERMAASLAPRAPLQALLEPLPQAAQRAIRSRLIRGVILGQNPRVTARQITLAMEGNQARALTIARTETLRAYRGAAIETYQRNSRIVGGWIWISALDPRTCAMCVAMHGSQHPASEEFGSHPNCRCSPAPLPVGAANPVTSGAEEFTRWSPQRQLATLGPSKYAAYRDGAVALSDLVGQERHPIWGLTRHERSLRSVLGDRASRYYAA